MKKSILFFISFFICNQLMAQYHGLTNFEDSNGLKISIDTSLENLWQIGKPDKPWLDSAHSLPNAIVTDTLHLYPPDNFSSFIIKVIPSFLPGGGSGLAFYHKFETDATHAGGYVECSLNKGKSWINVVSKNDTLFDIGLHVSDFYSPSDTLATGEPAFSGSSAGWFSSSINFGAICGIVKKQFLDTIMFRFVFKSDPFSTPHAGWAIDDISLNLVICSGIENLSVNNSIRIFPDPARDEIHVTHPENTRIIISDFLGREIKTIQASDISLPIDIHLLPAGIYFVNVFDKQNIRLFSGKFVKE